MLNISDCSDYFKTSNNFINPNPLAPQHPFRLLIVGPSGSGKTNMMLDLVLNHLHFNRIWIFAKDLEEEIYVFLKSFFNDCQEQIAAAITHDALRNHDSSSDSSDFDSYSSSEDEPAKLIIPQIAHFSNKLADVPLTDTLDPKLQNLIIFDDFINEKDQDIIKDLFIRSRKRNTSIIYLSQNYFKTPKTIRLNSQYFALFNIPSKKELRSIADTHSTRLDFKDFMQLYKEIVNEKYSFMLIDTVTTELPLHLRKNFDGLLGNL